MNQKQLDYMNHSRNAILKQYFYKMHLALNLEFHLSSILAQLQAKGIDTQKGDQNIQAQDRVLFNTNNQRIELSEQQAKCLKLLSQGLSAKEIALRCNLSYRTVEQHLANIMELTHTESSKQLLSLYYSLTRGTR